MKKQEKKIYEYFEYKIYLTQSEQKKLERFQEKNKISSFSKYLKEYVKGILKEGEEDVTEESKQAKGFNKKIFRKP